MKPQPLFLLLFTTFYLQSFSVTYTSLQALISAGLASGTCNPANDNCSGWDWCLSQTTFKTLYPPYVASAGEPAATCVDCFDSDAHCYHSQVCKDYYCVSCQSNADCLATVPRRPYCYHAWVWNYCYECSSSDPCIYPDKAKCDTSNSVCLPCTGDPDCSKMSGGKKKCLSGTCVQCTGAADCTGGNICDMTTHLCQGPPCMSDGVCTSTITTPACFNGACSSCSAKESVCKSISKVCSDDGSCQTCYLNQHCSNPALSKCSSNNCIICAGDPDCSHTAYKKCLLPFVGCVQCLTASDCPTDYSCSGYTCHPPPPISTAGMYIKLMSTDAPEIFLIEYPPDFVVSTDVVSATNVRLINVNTQAYTYQVVKLSTVQYIIMIRNTETIPATRLYLTYTTGNTRITQKTWNAEIGTRQIPYMTSKQREVSGTLKDVGTGASIAMGAASGSIIILGGNPVVLYALISVLQTFYYLTYINVNYPANVLIFLGAFNEGGFEFIPNSMELFFPDINNVVLPTPEKFQEYKVNGLFLANAGNMILILLVGGLTFVAAIALKKVFECASKILHSVFCRVVDWFHWSGILRILIISYPELTLAALLQVRVLIFEGTLTTLSSIFGIIFTAFGGVFPLLAFIFVKIFTKTPDKLQKRYGALVQEYTLAGRLAKYFTVYSLFRRLLTFLSLVFLHDYPYAQVSVLTGLGVLTIILLIISRPYLSISSNIIAILSEVLFTALHAIILIVVHDDHAHIFGSDETKLNYGWAMIACCGLVLALNLEVCVFEQIKAMKEAWRALKKYMENRKKLRASSEKKIERVRRRREERMEELDNSSEVPLELSHLDSSITNANTMARGNSEIIMEKASLQSRSHSRSNLQENRNKGQKDRKGENKKKKKARTLNESQGITYIYGPDTSVSSNMGPAQDSSALIENAISRTGTLRLRKPRTMEQTFRGPGQASFED